MKEADPIAALRQELAEHLRWYCGWRHNPLPNERALYREHLRKRIRRIRALDKLVEKARDRDYMARVWMYIACGLTREQAALKAREEMAGNG
jgi:hypothetical protein